MEVFVLEKVEIPIVKINIFSTFQLTKEPCCQHFFWAVKPLINIDFQGGKSYFFKSKSPPPLLTLFIALRTLIFKNNQISNQSYYCLFDPKININKFALMLHFSDVRTLIMSKIIIIAIS